MHNRNIANNAKNNLITIIHLNLYEKMRKRGKITENEEEQKGDYGK